MQQHATTRNSMQQHAHVWDIGQRLDLLAACRTKQGPRCMTQPPAQDLASGAGSEPPLSSPPALDPALRRGIKAVTTIATRTSTSASSSRGMGTHNGLHIGLLHNGLVQRACTRAAAEASASAPEAAVSLRRAAPHSTACAVRCPRSGCWLLPPQIGTAACQRR